MTFATMEMSGSSAWYLVHTKPRQESTALSNLTRQGYSCYLPQMRVERIRQHKLLLCTEPLFPRYLFVRLDASGRGKSWTPIRSTLGVSHLVHFGNRPARLPDGLIDVLQSRETEKPTETLFNAGDKVLITTGPFAGIEAVYQMPNAEQRSMVLLNILCKDVPLDIETAHLKKA